MKHTRPIVPQDWQQQIVRQYPERFLRGFFHSDGFRIRNWATRSVNGTTTRYEHVRYFFGDISEDKLDEHVRAEVLGILLTILSLTSTTSPMIRVARRLVGHLIGGTPRRCCPTNGLVRVPQVANDLGDPQTTGELPELPDLRAQSAVEELEDLAALAEPLDDDPE